MVPPALIAEIQGQLITWPFTKYEMEEGFALLYQSDITQLRHEPIGYRTNQEARHLKPLLWRLFQYG
jgi:hypothetical protein